MCRRYLYRDWLVIGASLKGVRFELGPQIQEDAERKDITGVERNEDKSGSVMLVIVVVPEGGSSKRHLPISSSTKCSVDGGSMSLDAIIRAPEPSWMALILRPFGGQDDGFLGNDMMVVVPAGAHVTTDVVHHADSSVLGAAEIELNQNTHTIRRRHVPW
ncbi:hypothetical protein BDZ89DRAFT_1050123 [Hymenopellis radicata]|nr:hypothetical protein BDZ89DRAFT_1050123 [Hymenopellis radicata]